MISSYISIFEKDTPYTQGFLHKPTPILFEKIPSDEGWMLEQALEVGLTIEEGNYRLYMDALGRITDSWARQLLSELVGITSIHKEQMTNIYRSLLGLSKECADQDSVRELIDLMVTDFLKTEPLTPEVTYQDVLIFAAKREKIGYEYFSIQANEVKNVTNRRIWERFADLKLRQKQDIEREYDDIFLREN